MCQLYTPASVNDRELNLNFELRVPTEKPKFNRVHMNKAVLIHLIEITNCFRKMYLTMTLI